MDAALGLCVNVWSWDHVKIFEATRPFVDLEMSREVFLLQMFASYKATAVSLRDNVRAREAVMAAIPLAHAALLVALDPHDPDATPREMPNLHAFLTQLRTHDGWSYQRMLTTRAFAPEVPLDETAFAMYEDAMRAEDPIPSVLRAMDMFATVPRDPLIRLKIGMTFGKTYQVALESLKLWNVAVPS